MRLPLFVVSLFFCASHNMYSMEMEDIFGLKFGQSPKLGASLRLDVAKTVPSIERLLSENNNVRSMVFWQATENNIKHLQQYIQARYMLKMQHMKHHNDLKKSLYQDLKKLNLSDLVQLTKNVCELYPNEHVPLGLLDPLVEKMQSGKDYEKQLPLLSDAVQEKIRKKVRAICTKNLKNKELLRDVNNQDKSIITSLIAPYCQALNKAVDLSPYYKSVLTTPVVEYIYVGNTIVVSLVGVAQKSCSHCNYVLTIQTQSGVVKTFTLKDKALDFHVKGAFANKDETLFVCPYSDPSGSETSCNQGLFIIDLKDNKTKQIACLYKACSFNSKNQILAFDEEGNNYCFNNNDNSWQSEGVFSCGQKINGLMCRENYIMWSNHCLFKVLPDGLSELLYQNNQSTCDAFYESISDVIVDSEGKKICIIIFRLSRKVEGKCSNGDSCYQYFLYDCCDRSTKLIKSTSKKLFVSFSSDGNLLTIGSSANGAITYDIFDMISCASWRKTSVGELVSLGNDKSVEVVEGYFCYYPKLIEVIDGPMKDVLKIVTNTKYCAGEVTPLKITTALWNQDQEFNYPPEIQKMLDFNATFNESNMIVKPQQWFVWDTLSQAGAMLKSPRGLFLTGMVMVAIVAMVKLIKK